MIFRGGMGWGTSGHTVGDRRDAAEHCKASVLLRARRRKLWTEPLSGLRFQLYSHGVQQHQQPSPSHANLTVPAHLARCLQQPRRHEFASSRSGVRFPSAPQQAYGGAVQEMAPLSVPVIDVAMDTPAEACC
jgi:hypothetical protein